MFYFKTLRDYTRVSLFLKTIRNLIKKTKLPLFCTSAYTSIFSVSLKNVSSFVQRWERIAEKINF